MARKLKTEIDTAAIGERVLDAFLSSDHVTRSEDDYRADHEHGQWWITCRPTGRQWSVVDAEGGSSVDGFDFECVTEGEEDY